MTTVETFEALEEAIIATRIAQSYMAEAAGLPIHVLQEDGTLRDMEREAVPLDRTRVIEVWGALGAISSTLCRIQKSMRPS